MVAVSCKAMGKRTKLILILVCSKALLYFSIEQNFSPKFQESDEYLKGYLKKNTFLKEEMVYSKIKLEEINGVVGRTWKREIRVMRKKKR